MLGLRPVAFRVFEGLDPDRVDGPDERPAARDQVDAVDRAGRQAQLAAGAFVGDDRVHHLRRPDDRVHRTGLDAQLASDAAVLVDYRHQRRFCLAVRGIQRFGLATQQVGQCLDPGFAARRTLVDVGLTACDGLGVGAAAGIVALPALGLRQDPVDLLDHRVFVRLPPTGTCQQYQAYAQQQRQHDADRNQDCRERCAHSLANPAKPMNASAISPAVTRPMGAPRKLSGTSAMAKRSRAAASSTRTPPKPSAAPKPYSADSTSECWALTFSNATPSTAQLLVINGR